MLGWIIAGGLLGWVAVSVGTALLVGAIIKRRDCCPHPEAGA